MQIASGQHEDSQWPSRCIRSHQSATEDLCRALVLYWYGAYHARHIDGRIHALAGAVAGRRAPISPLAAAHGIIFFAWLLIFLIQSSLIASRHLTLHRKLGLVSILILVLMVPLAYTTTVAMVRRAFDLSGI